jgi:hypothetical protein
VVRQSLRRPLEHEFDNLTVALTQLSPTGLCKVPVGLILDTVFLSDQEGIRSDEEGTLLCPARCPRQHPFWCAAPACWFPIVATVKRYYENRRSLCNPLTLSRNIRCQQEHTELIVSLSWLPILRSTFSRRLYGCLFTMHVLRQHQGAAQVSTVLRLLADRCRAPHSSGMFLQPDASKEDGFGACGSSEIPAVYGHATASEGCIIRHAGHKLKSLPCRQKLVSIA